MHNNLYKPQLKINFIEHAQTLIQSIINVDIKIGYAYCLEKLLHATCFTCMSEKKYIHLITIVSAIHKSCLYSCKLDDVILPSFLAA